MVSDPSSRERLPRGALPPLKARIRELQWDDFQSLVENYYSLYEEVRRDPELGITLFNQRPSMGDEAKWFAGRFKAIESGDSVVVVAEVDGRAVGICSIDRSTANECGHIGSLGILVGRTWRGRGIGRELIRAAVEGAKGKFDLVTLSVFDTNRHAKHLYESLGFRSWGLLPGGVRREARYIDLSYMVLDLRPSPLTRPSSEPRV